MLWWKSECLKLTKNCDYLSFKNLNPMISLVKVAWYQLWMNMNKISPDHYFIQSLMFSMAMEMGTVNDQHFGLDLQLIKQLKTMAGLDRVTLFTPGTTSSPFRQLTGQQINLTRKISSLSRVKLVSSWTSQVANGQTQLQLPVQVNFLGCAR